MAIENFKSSDAAPVYRRFNEKGRLMPDGLKYISSWVDTRLGRCFQLVESGDPALVQEWVANWSDLVDFEIIPVMTSAEAAAKISPLL